MISEHPSGFEGPPSEGTSQQLGVPPFENHERSFRTPEPQGVKRTAGAEVPWRRGSVRFLPVRQGGADAWNSSWCVDLLLGGLCGWRNRLSPGPMSLETDSPQ